MSPPIAVSLVEIPGREPLYFTGSFGPPQLSGQSLSKLLGSNTEHELDSPTRGGDTKSISNGVVSANNKLLKRAHAVMDHECLGQAQTTASITVEPRNAREDTAGAVSESDLDEEVEETFTTHKRVSDRRRAQNAKFNSWYLGNMHIAVRKILISARRLSSRAETITKEDIKAAVKGSDDDALSTRNLISKQESTVIITDPREYQMELFEKAKEENIIAVLDTGMGSVYIDLQIANQSGRLW